MILSNVIISKDACASVSGDQAGPSSTESSPTCPLSGGSGTLTGSIDLDFGAFSELFGALLVSSLVHVLFEIVFALFSQLLGSILSSQDDPPTFKNRAPASAAARFLKNRRLRSEGGLQSVLGLSWASFGRSWGSLGGLLGFSGVLLGVSWELLGSQGTILGSSWVLLLSFFSALLVRSSSKSLFFISRGLFGSILGLQDDPPTLENRAPASAAARFLKNRRLRSEDGLQSALGLSCARSGCS